MIHRFPTTKELGEKPSHGVPALRQMNKNNREDDQPNNRVIGRPRVTQVFTGEEDRGGHGGQKGSDQREMNQPTTASNRVATRAGIRFNCQGRTLLEQDVSGRVGSSIGRYGPSKTGAIGGNPDAPLVVHGPLALGPGQRLRRSCRTAFSRRSTGRNRPSHPVDSRGGESQRGLPAPPTDNSWRIGHTPSPPEGGGELQPRATLTAAAVASSSTRFGRDRWRMSQRR